MVFVPAGQNQAFNVRRGGAEAAAHLNARTVAQPVVQQHQFRVQDVDEARGFRR